MIPICGDHSSELNPDVTCEQPTDHLGPCGNGRQMWWSDAREAYAKAVREKAIEECAGKCEATGDALWNKSMATTDIEDANELQHEHAGCYECAEAIRSLKSERTEGEGR